MYAIYMDFRNLETNHTFTFIQLTAWKWKFVPFSQQEQSPFGLKSENERKIRDSELQDPKNPQKEREEIFEKNSEIKKPKWGIKMWQ